jgi:hypothetical protein
VANEINLVSETKETVDTGQEQSNVNNVINSYLQSLPVLNLYSTLYLSWTEKKQEIDHRLPSLPWLGYD